MSLKLLILLFSIIFTTRQLNVTKSNEESAKRQINKPRVCYKNLKRHFLHVLINDTADDLRKITKKRILQFLPLLQDIKIPLQKKLILWEIYKDNRRLADLRFQDFKNARSLITILPENDLFEVDVEDKGVIKFFGMLPSLSRRQASILMYALKLKHGNEIFNNSTYINNLNGLICGLNEEQLAEINPDIISKLDSQVFSNLWSCSTTQLKMIFNKWSKNVKNKYVENWTNKTISDLGFMARVLSPDDIRKVEPEAFSSFDETIIEKLNREQLNAINIPQINNLCQKCKAAYYLRKYSSNSSCRKNHLKSITFISIIIITDSVLHF